MKKIFIINIIFSFALFFIFDSSSLAQNLTCGYPGTGCNSPISGTCSSTGNNLCTQKYKAGCTDCPNGNGFACIYYCPAGQSGCTQFNGACVTNGGQCPVGYTYATYGVCPGTDECCTRDCPGSGGYCTGSPSCGNGYLLNDYLYCPGTDYCCSPQQTPPNCTGGQQYGACTGGTTPANTCGYTNDGSQSVTYTQPQVCTQNSTTQACNVYYNNCNAGAGYTCSNNNGYHAPCITNIYVHVYLDYNHDGIKNGPDVGFQGITISDNGGNTPKTDANGNVTFTGKVSGTYNITMTVPANYEVSNNGSTGPIGLTSYTQSVSLSPNGNQSVNFYLTPLYTVSGYAYNDANKNGVVDGGEGLVGWGVNITGIGINTSTSTNGAGAYSFSNLVSGNYNVVLTQNLPSGYSYLVPKPPTWSIGLGNPSGPANYVCSIGGASGATCGGQNNGSISGLNFSVSNENTYIQPICTDARFNNGYSQLIPSTANCGGTSSPYAIYTDPANSSCNANPGILYSGSTNPSYGTGTGASTPTNQVMGNANYPETFTSPIPNTVQTSYSFVMTSLNNLITPPTPLGSVCPSLSACDLSNLAPGVYTTTKADGPVTFTMSNPSYTLTSGNYTFAIGGDITFTTKVLIPIGSSAFFASGGNIHVTGNSALGNAGEVGESNWNSINPDLEGFFSADGSFYIDRVNPSGALCNADASPIDNKLNIKGSVVVNAAGNGGSLVNNRDGCIQDNYCPSVTFTTDPLQILHTPTPLKPPYTVWKELNP